MAPARAPRPPRAYSQWSGVEAGVSGSDRRLTFRVHAIARMFLRQINDADVRFALNTGEEIESYPDDEPYPSRLVLGWVAGRPVHVVAADNDEDDETFVITVYEPTSDLWEPDFKRRRSEP